NIVDSGRHIALIRSGQLIQRDLAWLGRPGITDLSPDGRTLLFVDGRVDATLVLGATDGTPPKVLGAGEPLALSPDGRRVAVTAEDKPRLFLVPTGAGTREEVLLSGLVLGYFGQWSRDGRRLWLAARQNDHTGFQLFPIDVATRKVLEPIPGSDIAQGTIAISPDDRWIAAAGTDGVLTV